MKFSTPLLYLENVAYDPLIRNFPISAAFQGEKMFFFKVQSSPKMTFLVSRNWYWNNSLWRHKVCKPSSLPQFLLFLHVVNYQ